MTNRCCLYAHYYFGSRFRYTWQNGDKVEGILDQFCNTYFFCGIDIGPERHTDSDYFEIGDIRTDGDFQLFLLLPSEMNEDQKEAHYHLCQKFYDEFGKTKVVETPESLVYKFRNSVDCFNLLNDGSALHLSILNALP